MGKSTLFNVLTKVGVPAENFPFCECAHTFILSYTMQRAPPATTQLIFELHCNTSSSSSSASNQPSSSSGTIEPNNARVHVPDERFNWLCSIYKPKSQVPAFLDVVDIAGRRG